MMRATTFLLALLMSDTAFAEEARRDLYGDPLPKGARMRLGTLRFRHTGKPIWCVKYSPDGNFLATGGCDNCIRLWNPHTSEELRCFVAHPNFPHELAFSPDGKLLASADCQFPTSDFSENTIRLWDIASGKCLWNIKRNGMVYSIMFSQGGKSIISGENKHIRMWETATGRCLHTLERHEGAVIDLSISPDGKLLASAGEKDGLVCLWELDRGELECTCSHNHRGVSGVRFAPDGKTFAAWDREGAIHLWNPATGKEMRYWKAHEREITSLAFTAKGRTLLSIGEDCIREWDAATGKQLRVLARWPQPIDKSGLSPDGKMAAAICFDAVRCWDLADGKGISPHRGHEASVNSVRFADKGKTLISTGADRSVRIWNLESNKELYRDAAKLISDDATHSVDLSVDGRTLALAATERSVCLRDRLTKKVLATLPSTEAVLSLCFSPDGKFLSVGDAGQIIHVWDVAAAKECHRRKGDTLKLPIFSPDSRLLAAPDVILVDDVVAPMYLGMCCCVLPWGCWVWSLRRQGRRKNEQRKHGPGNIASPAPTPRVT